MDSEATTTAGNRGSKNILSSKLGNIIAKLLAYGKLLTVGGFYEH